MCTIYKFIDKREKDDIQKNERISLSRPLLNFREPEGLLVGFFRGIYRLLENNQDILKIKPTDELLDKIKEWHTVYFDSFPEDEKASYNDC